MALDLIAEPEHPRRREPVDTSGAAVAARLEQVRALDQLMLSLRGARVAATTPRPGS